MQILGSVAWAVALQLKNIWVATTIQEILGSPSSSLLLKKQQKTTPPPRQKNETQPSDLHNGQHPKALITSTWKAVNRRETYPPWN